MIKRVFWNEVFAFWIKLRWTSSKDQVVYHTSYFFISLSCTATVAMQSFISHFNQYSLGDPLWATFPAGIDRGQYTCLYGVLQGVNHWLKSYDAEFDTTVILEIEFHENNTIIISHPNKHKRNWKIISTINVATAPIKVNWATNIAYSYFSQQQPAWSFTTLSNVMVLLCEIRHQ